MRLMLPSAYKRSFHCFSFIRLSALHESTCQWMSSPSWLTTTTSFPPILLNILWARSFFLVRQYWRSHVSSMRLLLNRIKWGCSNKMVLSSTRRHLLQCWAGISIDRHRVPGYVLSTSHINLALTMLSPLRSPWFNPREQNTTRPFSRPKTHNGLFQGHQVFQKGIFFLSCWVLAIKVENL